MEALPLYPARGTNLSHQGLGEIYADNRAKDLFLQIQFIDLDPRALKCDFQLYGMQKFDIRTQRSLHDLLSSFLRRFYYLQKEISSQIHGIARQQAEKDLQRPSFYQERCLLHF